MMKLSDVCKTIGVTRRTLQEYAKIGLLEPTKKTIGGYWYYDEDAVATLQHILIFVEAGYERKQIKEIINMRKPEILDEYDKAIKLLREKQEKIDGLIITLEVLKTAVSTPTNSVSFNIENEISTSIHGLSFMAKMRHLMKQLNRLKGVSTPLLRFLVSFVMLCNTYAKGVAEETLHECIDKTYEYGRIYIPEEFEEPDDLTDLELTEGVTEFIEDILQNPEGIAEIDKTYGEGTASGLMDVIHKYKGFVIYEDDEEPSDETTIE